MLMFNYNVRIVYHPYIVSAPFTANQINPLRKAPMLINDDSFSVFNSPARTRPCQR